MHKENKIMKFKDKKTCITYDVITNINYFLNNKDFVEVKKKPKESKNENKESK